MKADINTGLYYSTKRNYRPNSTRREDFTDVPSQTVQGDSYTIAEMFERYSNGIIPNQTPPVYMDVDDIEQINEFYNPGALDLTDLDRLQGQIDFMQEAVDKAQQRKQTSTSEVPPPVVKDVPETTVEYDEPKTQE